MMQQPCCSTRDTLKYCTDLCIPLHTPSCLKSWKPAETDPLSSRAEVLEDPERLPLCVQCIRVRSSLVQDIRTSRKHYCGTSDFRSTFPQLRSRGPGRLRCSLLTGSIYSGYSRQDTAQTCNILQEQRD